MPVGGRRDVGTLMPEGMKSRAGLLHFRGLGEADRETRAGGTAEKPVTISSLSSSASSGDLAGLRRKLVRSMRSFCPVLVQHTGKRPPRNPPPPNTLSVSA